MLRYVQEVQMLHERIITINKLKWNKRTNTLISCPQQPLDLLNLAEKVCRLEKMEIDQERSWWGIDMCDMSVERSFFVDKLQTPIPSKLYLGMDCA